jgi:hypothetical protein
MAHLWGAVAHVLMQHALRPTVAQPAAEIAAPQAMKTIVCY